MKVALQNISFGTDRGKIILKNDRRKTMSGKNKKEKAEKEERYFFQNEYFINRKPTFGKTTGSNVMSSRYR